MPSGQTEKSMMHERALCRNTVPFPLPLAGEGQGGGSLRGYLSSDHHDFFLPFRISVICGMSLSPRPERLTTIK